MVKRTLIALFLMTLLMLMAACAGQSAAPTPGNWNYGAIPSTDSGAATSTGQDYYPAADTTTIPNPSAAAEAYSAYTETLTGGRWTDFESDISLEFGENALLHYIQEGQDAAEYWLSYRIEGSKITVEVGGQTESWDYTLTDAPTSTMLCITWATGSKSYFIKIRESAAPGVVSGTQGSGVEYDLNFAADVAAANTQGNINNYGLMVSDGVYLYFNDAVGNGYLTRCRLDGSEKTVLIYEQAIYLNLLGNDLYFTAMGVEHCLYRMDTGTGESVKLAEGGAYRTMIVNGLIYCICDDEYLYSMNLDGTGQKQLSMTKAAFFCVMGDGIYYHSPEDNLLYHIILDGTDVKKVSDERLYPLSYLTVSGGYIYFIDDTGCLCRMGLDGKNKEVLYSGLTRCFNLYEDIIYFSSGADGKAYGISNEGGNPIMLENQENTTGYADNISVVGGIIYYWSSPQ